MMTRNLLLGIICSIAFLASCKSDAKELQTSTEASETTLTKSDTRERDSLQIVKKLESGGRDVNPAEISKMLDQTEELKQKSLAQKDGIPSVCPLLSPSDIASAFGIEESTVKESDGNRQSTPNSNSKSCFWRWNDSGIVVQISDNPLPEEVNDWGTRYINTKKSTGEKMMSSAEERFLFTDFKGPGKYNIYNPDLGKFYATKGEDLIISLIFNGNFNKRKQLSIATELLDGIFDKL